MTDAATGTSTSTAPTPPRSVAFSALVGLAALVIILQGVTAGIFLEHDGKRDSATTWIHLHAAGGYLAVLLAIAAAIVALLKLRERPDLLIGSGAFAILLVVEVGIGSAIHSGTDWLTAIHVPLAMAIVALAVWLPLRARGRG
jgi:hypothetical protein